MSAYAVYVRRMIFWRRVQASAIWAILLLIPVAYFAKFSTDWIWKAYGQFFGITGLAYFMRRHWAQKARSLYDENLR